VGNFNMLIALHGLIAVAAFTDSEGRTLKYWPTLPLKR